jgi:exodeoxyribonuclease-1
VTGITPQLLAEQGLCEAEFMTRCMRSWRARHLWCGLQHPALRRRSDPLQPVPQFFDPYAREWQGGNSRWDLIDMVRTAYALRPEGIVWPQQDGRTSLRWNC